MQIILNPYISFKDNAREALTFYKEVFGGELTLSTFGESKMADDPNEADNIMHGMLKTDNGLTLMGADTPKQMEYQDGARISISLSGDNHDELSGYFQKLSTGGAVTIPLEKAPWGDTFGMCTDQFGVHWMVNITSEK